MKQSIGDRYVMEFIECAESRKEVEIYVQHSLVSKSHIIQYVGFDESDGVNVEGDGVEGVGSDGLEGVTSDVYSVHDEVENLGT